MTFYDKLFPDGLKDFYYENQKDIKSIRVFSDEPWIPWEILKPNRMSNGRTTEEEFLCEKHSFSRWVPDGPDDRIKENRQIKKIKVIVPFDTNLKNAKAERDWIKNEFGTKYGLDISVDEKYKEVVNTLENGDFDILHFSTHGRYDPINPLYSALKMEKGYEIRVDRIGGKAKNFGIYSPLVVLNACMTGSRGYSLTGIDSWATSFIKAGACAFIGTMWSVHDKIASTFTKNLYEQLAKGETLGQAVRISRNKCKQDGNPSWLSYQLYGHPNAKIKIGSLVQ